VISVFDHESIEASGKCRKCLVLGGLSLVSDDVGEFFSLSLGSDVSTESLL